MKNKIGVNVRNEIWNFLHNRRRFWSDIRRYLHKLPLEKSEYYEDCVFFYSNFDVKDKIVIDVGDDFGTSSLFFLRKGARYVYGFSPYEQYFYNDNYKHYKLPSGSDYGHESFTKVFHLLRESPSFKMEYPIVLKINCRGCEWEWTSNFINAFNDWIITLYTPVKRAALYEYVKQYGDYNYMGDRNGIAIAVYEKKKMIQGMPRIENKLMILSCGIDKIEVLLGMGFKVENGYLTYNGVLAKDVEGNTNITPEEVYAVVGSDGKLNLITDLSQLEVE